MQKCLTQMNLQLANVISNIMGQTGQKICEPFSRGNGIRKYWRTCVIVVFMPPNRKSLQV